MRDDWYIGGDPSGAIAGKGSGTRQLLVLPFIHATSPDRRTACGMSVMAVDPARTWPPIEGERCPACVEAVGGGPPRAEPTR